MYTNRTLLTLCKTLLRYDGRLVNLYFLKWQIGQLTREKKKKLKGDCKKRLIWAKFTKLIQQYGSWETIYLFIRYSICWKEYVGNHEKWNEMRDEMRYIFAMFCVSCLFSVVETTLFICVRKGLGRPDHPWIIMWLSLYSRARWSVLLS